MHNTNDNSRQNLSPIAAGITGLILGIVGTAAVALSDQQTRTKVTKKANDMRDKMEKWSKDTLHELKATGEDVKKRAAEKSDELKAGDSTTKPLTEDRLTDEDKKVL